MEIYAHRGLARPALRERAGPRQDYRGALRVAPQGWPYHARVEERLRALERALRQAPPEEGPDDHADSAQGATPIRVGERRLGELGGRDEDWFALEAEAGATYTIRTERAGLRNSVLAIYDTDGTRVLAFNDDDPQGGRQARIVWTAPAGGTYYIVVHGFLPRSRGGYDLIVERQ